MSLTRVSRDCQDASTAGSGARAGTGAGTGTLRAFTTHFLIHGISNYMGLSNTRLGAWVSFSAGQAAGRHEVFSYMIVHT